MKCILAFTLVLVTIVCTSAMTVTRRNRTVEIIKHANWRAPSFSYTQISGRLVEYTKRNISLNGTIVMRNHIQGDPAVVLRDAEDRGAIGVIFYFTFTDYAGWQYTHTLKTSIPIITLGSKDGRRLIEYMQTSNSSIFVNIASADETNEWRDVYDSWVLPMWMAASVLFSACNCLLVIFKLYRFSQVSTLTITIATSCLGIELIANFIRMVYFAVDPIFFRGILSLMVANIVLTITLPMSVATTLLISLFWEELTRRLKVVVVAPFLTWFKWPYIITIFVLFAVDISTAVVTSLWGVGSIAIIFIRAVINFGVVLTITGFFFYTGTKILVNAWQSRSIQAKRKRYERVSKVSIFIMSSGIANIVFLGVGGLFATKLLGNPNVFIWGWFIAFLALNTVSLTQILAFTPPIPASNSTRSGRYSRSVGNERVLNSIKRETLNERKKPDTLVEEETQEQDSGLVKTLPAETLKP